MSTRPLRTIHELFRHHAEANADAVAIQTLNAPDLTYGGFMTQLHKVIEALTAWGIGHDDRVMIMLPNGPEVLIALHGVASVAVAFVLDPNAGADQVEYLMDFIQPKAILLLDGLDGAGRERAQALGVRIIDVTPTPQLGAGTFDFVQPHPPLMTTPVLNGPDDLSFLVSTSGTTALPKLIPKTQDAMLQGIQDLLELQAHVVSEPAPLVSLNYLPLHLNYGIWLTTGALISGGHTVCMPSLDLASYFDWLDRYRPTFLAGPPAVLEALLAIAPQHPSVLARHSLTYIHAGSATVSNETRKDINRFFNVPIVQTYGLTEVGIVSDIVLPAGSIEPLTSLGQPKFPERTRIMGQDGQFLPAGESGEVVLRFDVFQGYWHNPEADEEAFMNGWFRTGDEGVIDQNGNLSLLGRFKEVINNGGAKVSPNEVEAVLSQHPQVKEVAVFGLKNAEVGETVAAAVVGDVSERELRKFASERLPFYKVPTRIIIIAVIPKTAAGKVQRNRLAEQLGLTQA